MSAILELSAIFGPFLLKRITCEYILWLDTYNVTIYQQNISLQTEFPVLSHLWPQKMKCQLILVVSPNQYFPIEAKFALKTIPFWGKFEKFCPLYWSFWISRNSQKSENYGQIT